MRTQWIAHGSNTAVVIPDITGFVAVSICDTRKKPFWGVIHSHGAPGWISGTDQTALRVVFTLPCCSGRIFGFD